MAQVSATFTSGAIAEYSNNANQNRNAVALASAPRAIESVTIGQAREEWGGTQGNDYDVSVTVNYYDGSTLETTGSFNWVKNTSGGGINYFGIVFTTQPDDGFVPSAGYDRTYIFPVPGYEATFASLTSADDVDGSANFGKNEFNDLRAILDTNYGNTAELSLVKSATLNDGGDGVDVGDTISYTFTVENTGGLTVTDITLTDNLSGISLSGGPIASLAPGASDNSTFTGTYTITQTDIDNGGVRNTATVSGDSNGDGTDDVSDTSGTYSYLDQATDVVFNQTAALALVKTATLNDTDGSGDHSAGDTISYSFAIYNTGDQTVTGITISDPLVTVSGGPIDLASSASDTTTFTGTYTITQSDVDTGSVTNSAYVSGTDASGWTVSDTSGTAQDNDTSTVVTLTASPSIALIKGGVLNDGGDGTAHAGDTISYNFTITNTGNVTLSNIQISDAMLEGAGGTLTGGPISLAPGATNRFSFTGSYTLDADDISAGSVSNTATVTGSSPGNTGDVTDTSGTSETNDTNTVVSLNLSPSIEGWKLSTITDADGSGGLSAGDTIVYTISVKNTGNVVLTNVGVQSDTLEQADGTAPANSFSASDFSIVLGSSTTLNPGEVAQFRGSYAVAQADIDAGGLSNTAKVSGVYNSTTYTDDTHDAADTDGTTTNASDPTENLVPNVAPTLTGPNSSTGTTSAISVNENQTAVFSFSANEAVTWTISGDDAGKFSIDSSTGVLTFSSAPDYENPNDVGDTSENNTYVVVVTGEDAGGLTTSQTVTVTVLDLKGSVGGTVTNSNGSVAAGVTVYLRDTSNNQLATTTTDSAGEYSFTNLSAATYVVEFVHGTKGSRGRSARGQNNGRYVQSIVLVEENFDDVDGILIDPSGVVYNSLTRSPVSGAIVRLYVTRDDNGLRVEVQNSWLDTSGEGGLSGQTTAADGEYAFILNGSAPSGIYDIVVTPPSAFIFESLAIPATSGPYVPEFGAGIETIQTQSTAPTGGDATTYYLEFDFEITTDAATTSNGVINNHIPIDPVELTVTKTADTSGFSSPVTAGDTISYTITAENTGNVVLDNVSITDAQTPTGGSASSLTPTYSSGDADSDSAIDVGETWTWTVSYSLTQADIDAGGLSNLATVTVDDPDDNSITVESSASGNTTTGAGGGTGTSTTLSPSPGLTVTKTADNTSINPASAGDTISYTITVKNTGNVTFTSLSLTDALTSDEAWSASDGGDVDGTGALNVGETWTFTASYAITSSDITSGSVENVAYATGVPASGSNLTVYSGAQGVASTSTSDPSGVGGVVTTLTNQVNLIGLISDDLQAILSDDLAQTATQLSDQANTLVQGALDRTRGYDINACADRLNRLVDATPILFDSGSSKLKPEADEVLLDVSAVIMDCPGGTLFVEGHTDAMGSAQFNLELSYARATAVVDRLNQMGQYSADLIAIGYGEDRPVAENLDEVSRYKNRRVVFRADNQDEVACSDQSQRDASGVILARPGSITVDASGYVQDVDCSNNRVRELSLSVSAMDLDGNNDQSMISATFRQEAGVNTASLSGWYVSGYHSNTDVVNRATGSISGRGLAAGFYGVERRSSGLDFDYLLGIFAGQHDFDLDFSKTGGVIAADGDYRYTGANWRLGLSGETDVWELPIRPHVFISGANARPRDASVTASRGSQSERGTVTINSFTQRRVTAELNFVDLLADPDLTLSLAPRGFCEDSSLNAHGGCGYGFSASLEQAWGGASGAYAVVHYEELDRFDRVTMGAGYNWQVDGGSISGGVSLGSNGEPTLENRIQLSF